MSKALTTAINKHLAQYNDMRRSIAACHRFDECKDIVDKSVAMAAYFAQIKDTKTEVMFHRVKLRAWRRIGELLAAVNLSGCETRLAKLKRVKESLGSDKTVREMGDYRILDVLKLMEISDNDFEFAIEQDVRGSVSDLLKRTPAFAKAEYERARKAERDRQDAERSRNSPEALKQEQKRQELNRLVMAHTDELHASANQAMKEAKTSLARKDREQMKQVVLLLERRTHDVMLRAAYSQGVTVQDVLREGLWLWLRDRGILPGFNRTTSDKDDRPEA